MNKIVEELKKVKVFYIATIEDDQPRVRPFGSVTDIDGDAYICSGNFKDFYKQVKANSNIELCGMYDNTSWLRVSAKLEENNDIEIQRKILSDPTGPKGLYEPGDGKFVTFKLTNVHAFRYSFFSGKEEIK